MKDTSIVQISVEAVDANGNTGTVLVNNYGVIRRPLDVKILRVEGEDKKRFATTYELVLQSFSIPLRDFARTNRVFDPQRIREIRFVFAPSKSGNVIIDGIGFSKLDPAYMVAGREDQAANQR